jgi:hypothetical protein
MPGRRQSAQLWMRLTRCKPEAVMAPSNVLRSAALACLVLLMPDARAQQAQSPLTPTAPAAGAAAPTVSEEADRLLREMGKYIATADQFTVHADITFDHVLPSGQKLQYSATEEIALQRPNQLYIEYDGDLGQRRFWYDGQKITLFDTGTPFYASEAAPPQMDAALQKMSDELDFLPPLSDFLYSDPYRILRKNVLSGFAVGIGEADGRRCHHLAFTEEDADWEIWIEDGPQQTPCKVVIQYLSLPGQPQFSAVFSDWNFAPRIAEPAFTAELPPDAKKIPFRKIPSTK